MSGSAKRKEVGLSKAGRDERHLKAPLTRSEIMQRVKHKDSTAELALRSALHHRGLRFRLHRKVEGIRVDFVFVSAKVAVFVDGCFWHECPLHATFPKSNQSYWLPKLAANKERDRRQTAKLQAAGWYVIRAWEHECLPPSHKIVGRIEKAVLRRLRHEGSADAR